MSAEPSVYIHGTSQEEQVRLSLLNDLLNARSLNTLDITGGEKILDVGSGLGQFSRTMARAAGKEGTVLGIERSHAQLNQAIAFAKNDGEEKLVEFRQGDALNLPLKEEEWNSFDIVHTRFVLEHVPNPQDIVNQMFKAAKPGGKIILADDDHATCRVIPESPGFQTLWNAYCRSYDRIGNDPYVGRKLVSFLHKAGANQKQNGLFFFGDCNGNETFEHYALNLIGVIEGAKKLIIKEKLVTKSFFENAIENLHNWKNLPDAALWYSVCWAKGIKP